MESTGFVRCPCNWESADLTWVKSLRHRVGQTARHSASGSRPSSRPLGRWTGNIKSSKAGDQYKLEAELNISERRETNYGDACMVPRVHGGVRSKIILDEEHLTSGFPGIVSSDSGLYRSP